MEFNITGEVFQNVLYLLIGAMLAALAGIWAGWFESLRKNKNDIKKIKNLLKSDFSRINDLAIENIESIEKELKKFDLEEDPYAIQDKELKDLFERKRELDDYLINFYYEYEFNFWTALVSSGSLIKLKEIEIQDVQTAYESYF